MTTHSTTDNTVSIPVPANKKLLSDSAPFYYIETLDDCICRVKKGVPLLDIAEELMKAIGSVSQMLELVNSRQSGLKLEINRCEVRLMLARLDQANGLCLSILNTIEDIEEEEDLSNE